MPKLIRTESPWTVAPGQEIERSELLRKYGGGTQGGIRPSSTSSNIMLFYGDDKSRKHGYIDGWKSDGLFDYTGTGWYGDQTLTGRNGSVLNHAAAGRVLRLFKGTAEKVRYVGRFELDTKQPYYRTDAPETKNGPMRSVVVFRLRPIEPAIAAPSTVKPIAWNPHIQDVAVEQQHEQEHQAQPSAMSITVIRREASLVLSLKTFLESHGYTVVRKSILAPGSIAPMLTDLFAVEMNLLIEAKGTVERGAFREALGQLADYRRFLATPRCAILLPLQPCNDLENLAKVEGVYLIWPIQGSFAGLSDLGNWSS